MTFRYCKLSVTGKGRKGNSNFDAVAQDVVDLIRESFERFARDDSRVSAKGNIQCNGNIGKQDVECNLY